MLLTEVRPLLNLLTILTPYEPRYTLASLAHIAQACGRIAVYNKELIDRIIIRYILFLHSLIAVYIRDKQCLRLIQYSRLNKELQTARLKDLERFILTFSILNIDSSNSIYQNVIEELRTTWDTTRAFEIEK